MFGDVVEVFQGELTLSQLSIAENIIDQSIHHPLDSCRRWVVEGTTCCLDDIRQHHQACFLRLGFGARIAIIVNIDGRQFGTLRGASFMASFLSFIIKEGYEARSMVLADDVNDGFAQAVLPCQLDALFDMGDENQTAHRRGKLLMAILTIKLVFDEINRFLDFADIMIIGGNLGQ
jgi:hypothetical protein